MYIIFFKVEFPTNRLYAISEKILKKALWQHHQTKLSVARMPAIKFSR
jgi:hypothetical protein